MLYWFGNDEAGAVDRCGDEAIVTEFWCVVVPVQPLRSYYRSRDEHGEPTATPIALNRRSVIAGYLRTTLCLATVIVAAPVLAAPDRWLALWPAALALATAAAWFVFGYGRLDHAERERRELLRRVVGCGAPPELLAPATRALIRDALAERWDAHAQSWPEAIMAGVADEALVALAEYHARPALAERARLNLTQPDDLPLHWN